MIDLTEIFNKVVTSNVDWQFSMFYSVIDTLRNNNVNLSFWEGEENWASIIRNDKARGYIWKKYPFIVIEKGIASHIRNLISDFEGIYYIEVGSLNTDLFKIEEHELQKSFGDFNSFDSFTMEDLWFQTNNV